MSRFIGIVSAYAYAVSQGYTGTEDEYAELMASYATVAEEAAESAESASQSATQAGASAQTATTKASEASQSATQAGTKASQASTSATQASASATSASQSASTATTKASEASASASTASTKASEASTSATTASSKASEASASATSAQTAQGLAESARDDAVDAKTDAETARDMAQQYAESIDPENIYSAYPTDTASGDIITFADGADDIPMKSVKVAIEPVQDLHGYDHPWPAGGGKNLFDSNTIELGSYTDIGYSIQDGDTTYRRFKISLPSGTYTFSTDLPNCYIIRLLINDVVAASAITEQFITFTFENPSEVKFAIRNTDSTEITDLFNAQIELGSTATTYEPYSNICPISGWTVANVVSTGVNVWDEEYRLGFYSASGVFVANTSGYFSSKNPIPVKPNSEYMFCIKVASNQTFYVPMYYRDGTFKTRLGYTLSGGVRIITVPEDVYFIGFSTETFYGTTYNNDISINYPSTDHDYHPYTGNTYPITFPTEAGTVYGGELDVTNGTLTVDRAFIASYNGETLPSEWISDRDKYVAGTTPTTGAQVVYKLATPITYTLTPTEIKSLLGDNNLWADAGDTEVIYRADPNLYIDKRIGTEAPMVATDNIVSGSYFMVGNNLYKATANIASGATVIVGTNAVAKTMAEALNEINA